MPKGGGRGASREVSHGTAALLAVLSLALSAIAGGPREAVQAAYGDIVRQPLAAQPRLRWLYVGHMPANERQEMWQVTSGLVNGLSRKASIALPVVVLRDEKDPSGYRDVSGLTLARPDWAKAVLFRVLLDDYGTTFEQAWEQLAGADPYLHDPHNAGEPEYELQTVKEEYGWWKDKKTGKRVAREFAKANPDAVDWVHTRFETVVKRVPKTGGTLAGLSRHLPQTDAKILYQLAQSNVPVVYADWWMYQVAISANRKPGYHDFLGFADRKEFHNLLGFDEVQFKKQFAEFLQELRAAVSISGVSQKPRRIARFEKIGGGLWITFDSEKVVALKNPIENAGDENFEFQATEEIGHLPNGMLAYGLFTDKGERQDTAPDFIGFDRTTTGTDGKIHSNLSCIRCHDDGGLKDIRDWYRNLYRPPVSPGATDKKSADAAAKKVIELQEQYLRRRLEPYLETDRARYEAALLQATGLTSGAYAAAVRKRWEVYADQHVDVYRAAREWGVTVDHLQGCLQKLASDTIYVDPVFGVWLHRVQDEGLLEWMRPSQYQKVHLDLWHQNFQRGFAIVNEVKP